MRRTPFALEVHTTDGQSHRFENVPPQNAQECIRFFTERIGHGLTFQRDNLEMFDWPWDEIAAVRIVVPAIEAAGGREAGAR